MWESCRYMGAVQGDCQRMIVATCSSPQTADSSTKVMADGGIMAVNIHFSKLSNPTGITVDGGGSLPIEGP